jgi:hypothetical protein
LAAPDCVVKDFLRQLAEEQEEKEEKDTQLKKTTSGGSNLGATGYFNLALGQLDGKLPSDPHPGKALPPLPMGGEKDSEDGRKSVIPQAQMTSMLDELKHRRKGAVVGPAPAAKKLEIPWQEYIDTESSLPYYVHLETGASQWEPPSEPYNPAEEVELNFVEEDEEDESKLSE